MITITKVETIDEAMYNYMRCPECNAKMGWKPKDELIHVLHVFHISSPASGKLEPMGLSCNRCKAHYLITSEAS